MVKNKILAASVYTILLALTGYLLLPYGLSKIMDTPSWGILSSMYSLIVFVVLYVLIDVYHKVKGKFYKTGRNKSLIDLFVA